MDADHTTRQANRVSNVSDSLDTIPARDQKRVWDAARKLYADGNHSFLEAFEIALTRYSAGNL